MLAAVLLLVVSLVVLVVAVLLRCGRCHAATRPGCQFHAVTLAVVLLVVLVCGVLFVLLLLLFCACVLSPGRAAKFMY